MNKSESKYFNTARIIDQALIELLAMKEIEYITVKEICEKAGVNRSTFYLHYETIGDLLSETIEYVETQYSTVFKDISFNPSDDIEMVPLKDLVFINRTYLMPYLQFVYDNRTLYKAYINNQVSMRADSRFNWLKKNIFEPIMERFNVPREDRKYWVTFTVSGIWAIIQEWINDDCVDSMEHIAKMIEDCIPKMMDVKNEHDNKNDG